jgi:hypothetical protein
MDSLGGTGFNYRCRCQMLSSILFLAATNFLAVAAFVPVAGSVATRQNL